MCRFRFSDGESSDSLLLFSFNSHNSSLSACGIGGFQGAGNSTVLTYAGLDFCYHDPFTSAHSMNQSSRIIHEPHSRPTKLTTVAYNLGSNFARARRHTLNGCGRFRCVRQRLHRPAMVEWGLCTWHEPWSPAQNVQEIAWVFAVSSEPASFD